MLETVSILLGIASLICSIISLFKASNAKKVADETKKEVSSVIQGKQKISLIQKLIEACDLIRNISFQYRKRSIPQSREEEIEKYINVLKDNKHIVKNTEIETQINELSEQIKNPKVLHEATGVLISSLNSFKYENDFNV